jgi:hypothetical protein
MTLLIKISLFWGRGVVVRGFLLYILLLVSLLESVVQGKQFFVCVCVVVSAWQSIVGRRRDESYTSWKAFQLAGIAGLGLVPRVCGSCIHVAAYCRLPGALM